MPKNTSEQNPSLPKVSFIKTIALGVRLYMRASPVIFIVNNLVGVGNGLLIGVGTMLQQRLFDSIEHTMDGTGTVKAAIIALFIYGAMRIVGEILNGADAFLYGWQSAKFKAETARLIHKKMGALDPVVLEDTKVQDQINKAQQGAIEVGSNANIGVWMLLFYIPYLLFMALYLNTLNAKLILALACVFVPTLFGQALKTRVTSKLEEEVAPLRRRYDFCANAVIGKDFFKESRLLGAYKKLLDRFLDTCRLLAKAEWKANKKENLIELCTTALSVAGWGGIVYLLVSLLISKEISVGAFAAVFASIGMVFDMMSGFLHNIGGIAKDFGVAKNFVRFLKLPERGGTAQHADDARGISLRNVSFTYPNAKAPSIDNISLDIAFGETIAVVGANGAGKSTLVRLLTGYYKPTDGIVFARGMDTRHADAPSLFNGLSGVFQKYQRYKMTLSENVRISENGSDSAETEPLGSAGVEITGETFPDGLATMLSREFDGVDLSGGQWQRLAIARGLYRGHGMIVLDEPTAAIDPIEETRIYNQFVEISRGKTTVIVTHRLGSVKTADRVVVMDGGRIIAAAPHDALLRDCKEYADMYASQAQWYGE